MLDTCIAIIGAGRVGAALGTQWTRAGYRVVYGSRDPSSLAVKDVLARSSGRATAVTPAEAAASAKIILLSVPWQAARSTLLTMGSLTGKIIIDATNLFEFPNGQHREVEVPRSGGELIQEWAPGASVVKGFNATNWRVMADLRLAGGPVSIPLASDDPAATAEIARLVSAIGFEPADMGPLSNARHIEHMAFLYVNLLLQPGPAAFEFHLRPRSK